MRPSFIMPSGWGRFRDFLIMKKRFLKSGLFLGVALCVLIFFTARYWMPKLGFDEPLLHLPSFLQSAFWHDSASSLLELMTALAFTVFSVLLIFCLSACSAFVRRLLRVLMTVLVVMPMIVLTGAAGQFLGGFWAVSVLAASTLIMRCVSPVLNIEPSIPPLLLKSAKAMRLTAWQQFWRLHIPLAYPTIARSIALEMPHFWIRFLGAEWLLSFLVPAREQGLGGYIFLCLRHYDTIGFCEGFCLILVLVLLFQAGCVRPLFRRIRRYDVATSSPLMKGVKAEGYEQPFGTFWQKGSVMLGLFFLAGLSFSSSVDNFLPILASSVKSLCLWGGVLSVMLVFWGMIGGLTIRQNPFFRARVRYLAYLSTMIPLFLFFPFLKSFPGEFLLLALTIQGAYGASIFYRNEDTLRNSLIEVAYRLRLSGYHIWRHVKLPLLAPSLARGILLASYPLWDLILLAGMMVAVSKIMMGNIPALHNLGGMTLAALRDSHYAMQGGIFFFITALSYGLTYLLFFPLCSHIHRKFRMHP